MYSESYNGCMVRSLSAAIPQIVPVVTTDVGHLVDSPVVVAGETIAVKPTAVEIAAVAISALSQTEAAVKIAAVAISALSQTEAAVKIAAVAIADLSQTRAAVKIAPVAIANLSQTRAAVKIAPVAIDDLSQAGAAVVRIDPDSAVVVSADHDPVPAVPVTAHKTIVDPAARYHAIDARLRPL